MQNQIKRKTWKELKETGLILIINQILHIFGWAIVLEVDKETKEKIIDIYPARVTYRGFNSTSTSKAYRNISKYLVNNCT